MTAAPTVVLYSLGVARYGTVSPVPSECGLGPKGDDRPNPMVGFLRVYAEEEVK